MAFSSARGAERHHVIGIKTVALRQS